MPRGQGHCDTTVDFNLDFRVQIYDLSVALSAPDDGLCWGKSNLMKQAKKQNFCIFNNFGYLLLAMLFNDASFQM